MRRIWERSNPNAPSDSEEDEDDKAGVPDHVSTGSRNMRGSIVSTDGFDNMIAEEGMKAENLMSAEKERRSSSFISNQASHNQLIAEIDN